MVTYYCLECHDTKDFPNLKDYYRHKLEHSNYSISESIIEYFNEITIPQYIFDNLYDDGDILCYVMTEHNDEQLVLDILERFNIENVTCIYEIDDNDELENYLFTNYISTDMNRIIERCTSLELENLYHMTNKSLLMHCIKKGWRRASLKILDYPSLARVKKQNVTNASEMARKAGYTDIYLKIETLL